MYKHLLKHLYLWHNFLSEIVFCSVIKCVAVAVKPNKWLWMACQANGCAQSTWNCSAGDWLWGWCQSGIVCSRTVFTRLRLVCVWVSVCLCVCLSVCLCVCGCTAVFMFTVRFYASTIYATASLCVYHTMLPCKKRSFSSHWPTMGVSCLCISCSWLWPCTTNPFSWSCKLRPWAWIRGLGIGL